MLLVPFKAHLLSSLTQPHHIYNIKYTDNIVSLDHFIIQTIYYIAVHYTGLYMYTYTHLIHMRSYFKSYHV